MSNLNDFLGELASDSPTPGGGSVAALSGALGAALSSMVCNLTIGKKKYAGVEGDMKNLLAETEALRLELSELIEEDAEAFEKVMGALRLPKETDEEKQTRRAALEKALVDAVAVPLAVMRKCVAVVDLARIAAGRGNTNAVSDAGVAALMGRAGAHAAALNVRINLGGIRSEEHHGFVEEAGAALDELAAKADRGAEGVMEIVVGKL